MNKFWKIIYPGGVQSRLDIAEMWDYEESEYSIASRCTFYNEDAAYGYMVNLAESNGLAYNRKRNEFLD